MAATTHTCVIIACDVCGNTWDGEGPYHWDSIGDARTAASSEYWIVFSDGTAICGSDNKAHDDHALALRPKLTPGQWGEILDQRPGLDDEED